MIIILPLKTISCNSYTRFFHLPNKALLIAKLRL